MATNFERSALKVLECFRDGVVKSTDDLYAEMGDSIFGLSLRDNTVEAFVDGLSAEKYLEPTKGKFRLTEKGKRSFSSLRIW